MNISNREKIMLFILGIILIGIGYYNFVYTTMINKVEVKKQEKTQKEEEYNQTIATINALEDRKGDIKILKSKISDCAAKFYPTISQEHIILELDKLLNDSSLKGGITFEPIASSTVEDVTKERVDIKESSLQKFVDNYDSVNGKENSQDSTKNKDSNIEKNSNVEEKTSENNINQNSEANVEEKKENTIQYIKCVVNFDGTYKSLDTFLNKIGNNEKKIVVNSINITQKSLDGVSGTLGLEIYAVPRIDDELENYLKWILNNIYGREIPFSPGAATGTVKSETDTSDFVISANSINSDLPTVVMGKSNDDGRITYVYADKNSAESIQIELNQYGDKYYYKYKTSRGTYPKDYSGEGAQFAPESSSSISLDVFSEKRVNSDDKSGVNIKVINNTDKLFNINISGDDTVNPRVAVDGDSSKISVNKK